MPCEGDIWRCLCDHCSWGRRVQRIRASRVAQCLVRMAGHAGEWSDRCGPWPGTPPPNPPPYVPMEGAKVPRGSPSREAALQAREDYQHRAREWLLDQMSDDEMRAWLLELHERGHG